jgi:predicted AAA+ superfamily ATPase
MFPLPFSEYVKLFGINLPTRDLKFVLENYTNYIGYLPKLKEILEYYLTTGGFPNAIKDFVSDGKVSKSAEYDFISSIISDINKLRRSERNFSNLLLEQF